MQIGKLDRPIRVEKKQVTTDADYGGEVVDWVTHLTTWAKVTDIVSAVQEATNNDLRQLKRPCKVIMRYNDTITADMRLVMLDRDNRTLQIVNKPAEIGRKEAIEFTAHDYEV